MTGWERGQSALFEQTQSRLFERRRVLPIPIIATQYLSQVKIVPGICGLHSPTFDAWLEYFDHGTTYSGCDAYRRMPLQVQLDLRRRWSKQVLNWTGHNDLTYSQTDYMVGRGNVPQFTAGCPESIFVEAEPPHTWSKVGTNVYFNRMLPVYYFQGSAPNYFTDAGLTSLAWDDLNGQTLDIALSDELEVWPNIALCNNRLRARSFAGLGWTAVDNIGWEDFNEWQGNWRNVDLTGVVAGSYTGAPRNPGTLSASEPSIYGVTPDLVGSWSRHSPSPMYPPSDTVQAWWWFTHNYVGPYSPFWPGVGGTLSDDVKNRSVTRIDSMRARFKCTNRRFRYWVGLCVMADFVGYAMTEADTWITSITLPLVKISGSWFVGVLKVASGTTQYDTPIEAPFPGAGLSQLIHKSVEMSLSKFEYADLGGTTMYLPSDAGTTPALYRLGDLLTKGAYSFIIIDETSDEWSARTGTTVYDAPDDTSDDDHTADSSDDSADDDDPYLP